jgi:hypothetical protein
MTNSATQETIFGYGHKNVQSTHPSTLEFTKENELSKNGDCILVVAINRGLTDLSNEFKKNLCKPEAKLTITIEADKITEQIQAKGSPQLNLTHPKEMVIRKSNFTSDRTLAIDSNKSAKDLSRALVEKLKNPNQKVKITLTIES